MSSGLGGGPSTLSVSKRGQPNSQPPDTEQTTSSDNPFLLPGSNPATISPGKQVDRIQTLLNFLSTEPGLMCRFESSV